MRVLLVVAGALALAAPAAALGAAVPLRHLAWYDIVGNGSPGAQPRYQVLEDVAEWERVYAQIGVPAPAPPDFGVEVVLAADQGPRSQECGFAITSAREPTPGARSVHVYNAVLPRLDSLCLQVFVHDVRLAAVPRAAGVYVFMDELTAAPVGTDIVS